MTWSFGRQWTRQDNRTMLIPYSTVFLVYFNEWWWKELNRMEIELCERLTEMLQRLDVSRDCSRMSRNCWARPVCMRSSDSRWEMTRSLVLDSSRYCRHIRHIHKRKKRNLREWGQQAKISPNFENNKKHTSIPKRTRYQTQTCNTYLLPSRFAPRELTYK